MVNGRISSKAKRRRSTQEGERLLHNSHASDSGMGIAKSPSGSISPNAKKANNSFSNVILYNNGSGGSPKIGLERSPSVRVSCVDSEDYDVEFIKESAFKQTVAKSFISYSQETSLHGWKYVSSQNSTTCEKTAWLILLVASLVTASLLVWRAVGDFFSHTVSTNMDSLSTSFANIYFPAITVCNMNFIQRSVLEKYHIQNNDTLIDVFDRMINTGTETQFTEEELRMFDDIERMTNGSARFKMEGHPKCHNMFLTYSWKNSEVNFADGQHTMHYGQTTDESVCCQIFPGMLPWENNNEFDINDGDFWTNRSNPWQFIFDGYKKGIKPGKQGVQVLIDVETYEYFSVHSSGSEGVLVLIQHYRDIPLMRKESFVLAPGFEVDVGLSITEITTTSGAIERFQPDERDCYTHDEVNLVGLPLRKGYRMSMKNCLYDKALHATKEECGCSPPFYVLGALGKLPTCKGTQLHCAYKIFDDVVQYRSVGTARTCRAPCNDQVYDSRIAFASYPNKALFSKQKEICPMVRKLIKICTGWLDPLAISEYGQYPDELKIKKNVLVGEFPTLCENLKALSLNDSCEDLRRTINSDQQLGADLFEYAKRNLLWLNVYVKDSFATRIVRDEKMTRTSFVANVGGILGLCMGFSLVSVAEILYFSLKKQTIDSCRRGNLKKRLKRRLSRKQSRNPSQDYPSLSRTVNALDGGIAMTLTPPTNQSSQI